MNRLKFKTTRFFRKMTPARLVMGGLPNDGTSVRDDGVWKTDLAKDVTIEKNSSESGEDQEQPFIGSNGHQVIDVASAVSETGANLSFDEVGAVALDFYTNQPTHPASIHNNLLSFDQIPFEVERGSAKDWDKITCGFGSLPTSLPHLQHVTTEYENLALAPLDSSPWGLDQPPQHMVDMSAQSTRRLRRARKSLTFAGDVEDSKVDYTYDKQNKNDKKEMIGDDEDKELIFAIDL